MNKTPSAFFLFGPKFAGFGADMARALAAETDIVRVHGLVTGNARLVGTIRDDLGPLAGELHQLSELEGDWASRPIAEGALDRIERTYPAGTYGRTITADRRVGLGFVGDGVSRPDPLGDAALADPDELPRRYVAALYAWAEETLTRLRPSVVFCYAVAGAPAFALGIVAAVRGIPFAAYSATRIGSGYMVDTDLRQMLAPAADRFRDAPETLAPHRDAARAYLTAFRDRPETPDYQKFANAQIMAQRPGPQILRLMAKSLVHATRSRLTGDAEAETRYRRKWAEIRALRARSEILRRATLTPADMGRPYVFFPLHVAPESSVMIVTPMLTNQIAVIEALAKSLPADMVLAVKEHLPMLGLRPPGWYDRIAAIPGVVLLRPDVPGLEAVASAALTAVISGTAAWEAMCLRRPALVVGDLPALCIGAGAVHESDLTRLPLALRQALTVEPATDAQIVDYIAAVMAESFDMPSSLLWGDYASHGLDVRADAAGATARALAKLIGKVR